MIEFYNAVKAMLPANLNAHIVTVKFVDAEGKVRPPVLSDYPYVVLWGSPGNDFSGEPGDASLGDRLDGKEFRFRATYVGANPDALSIVLKRCRAAWNRQTPTVAGFHCSKLRQSALQDAQPDTDVTITGTSNHPLFAVDEFVLVASSL